MKFKNEDVGKIVRCEYCGCLGELRKQHSDGWLMVEFFRPVDSTMVVKESSVEPTKIIEMAEAAVCH